MRKIRLLAALLGSTLMAYVPSSLASVIDFNQVVNGAPSEERSTPLTTQGFTFSSTHFHIYDGSPCGFGGCAVFTNSQYLMVDGYALGQPVTMTEANGLTFDLTSLSATKIWGDGTASALQGFPNADFLEVVGTLQGGGTVSVSFLLPALSSYGVFSLPSTFTNLTSVEFFGTTQLTNDASFGIDNINGTVNSPGPSVPEPGTSFLLTSGILLLLALGSRRRHN